MLDYATPPSSCNFKAAVRAAAGDSIPIFVQSGQEKDALRLRFPAAGPDIEHKVLDMTKSMCQGTRRRRQASTCATELFVAAAAAATDGTARAVAQPSATEV